MNCDDMRELPLAEKEIVFSEWMSDWLISNNMEVKIIILCYSPLHACGEVTDEQIFFYENTSLSWSVIELQCNG